MSLEKFKERCKGKIIPSKKVCFNYNGDLMLGELELMFENGDTYVYCEEFGDSLCLVDGVDKEVKYFTDSETVKRCALVNAFTQIGISLCKWIVETWEE